MPSEAADATRPACIDLFSGCGGFSTGLENAGFEPVIAVDLHRPSIDTFRANHPRAVCVRGDIRAVQASKIARILAQRKVDPVLLTAGIPCQGFSLSNRKRDLSDERNFLFEEMLRMVRALAPPIVMIENVGGLASAGSGAFLNAIQETLDALGYRIAAQILDASAFGVPQRRRRLVIVAWNVGGTFAFPEPSTPIPVTVGEAILDLPVLASGERSSAYGDPPHSAYAIRMRADCNELHDHQAPSHPKSTIARIARTAPGAPMYASFKQRIRLHRDRPSPTQVSGGIRAQFSFGHPTQSRGLSIRERCRIQSFPDRHVIHGGLVQGRVQTGNAVPPLLAEAIGHSLRRLVTSR